MERYGFVRIYDNGCYDVYLGGDLLADSPNQAMHKLRQRYGKTERDGWKAVLFTRAGYPVVSPTGAVAPHAMKVV